MDNVDWVAVAFAIVASVCIIVGGVCYYANMQNDYKLTRDCIAAGGQVQRGPDNMFSACLGQHPHAPIE